MGMTNRQWQGWLRTTIRLLQSRIEIYKDNEAVRKELESLLQLFQSMLEDGVN